MTRALLLCAVWLVLSAPALAQSFRTVPPPAETITAADIGGVLTADGNTTVWLPPPDTLPAGGLVIRKGDNGAGPVFVKREDEQPITGWTKLTLAMHGDHCEIATTGTEYLLLNCGSALPGTNGGQHRTPLRSIYPWFFIGPWDRGAVIRYCSDTGESGNVVLPSAETAGFVTGGYRNGFTVTILAACLPPGEFVAIHAFGSSIHRKGEYLLLTREFESITVDFDGHEWFIQSHYVPSDEPGKP